MLYTPLLCVGNFYILAKTGAPIDSSLILRDKYRKVVGDGTIMPLNHSITVRMKRYCFKRLHHSSMSWRDWVHNGMYLSGTYPRQSSVDFKVSSGTTTVELFKNTWNACSWKDSLILMFFFVSTIPFSSNRVVSNTHESLLQQATLHLLTMFSDILPIWSYYFVKPFS